MPLASGQDCQRQCYCKCDNYGQMFHLNVMNFGSGKWKVESGEFRLFFFLILLSYSGVGYSYKVGYARDSQSGKVPDEVEFAL